MIELENSSSRPHRPIPNICLCIRPGQLWKRNKVTMIELENSSNRLHWLIQNMPLYIRPGH